MEKDFNQLIEKANNGDIDSLKEVIKFLNDQGDKEAAEYYESLLKNSKSPKKEETSEDTEDVKEKVQKKQTKKSKKETFEDVRDRYKNYSILELRDSENSDAFACYSLGEMYREEDNYPQSVAYYKKAIKLLEIKDNLEDSEKPLLCYCYTRAGTYLKAFGDASTNKELITNLQNAIEIQCDEKYKVKAYEVLRDCYKKGIGVGANSQKANEYNIKAYSATPEGRLKLAVSYQKNNNKIDYEYWLEKAKELCKTSAAYSKEYKEQIQNIAELKLALFHNKEDATTAINGTQTLIRKKDDGKYFTEEEARNISIILSKSCSNSRLAINEHDDKLLISCIGTLIILKFYGSDSINFFKQYTLISKDSEDGFKLFGQEELEAIFEYYDGLCKIKGDDDAFQWLKEFATNNKKWNLDSVLKEKEEIYLKKVEEQKQEEKRIAEEKAAQEKALAEAKEKERLRLEEEENKKRLALEQAEIDCKEIEKRIIQKQQQAYIIKQQVDKANTAYTYFSVIMGVFYLICWPLADSIFLPKLWSILATIILLVWLIRTFVPINGYSPQFAENIILALKQLVDTSLKEEAIKRKQSRMKQQTRIIDFDIEFHTDRDYGDSETSFDYVYFGKFEDFNYITDEAYGISKFFGMEVKNVEAKYASIKIKGYETVFKGSVYENILFINVPGNELLHFGNAIRAKKVPVNANKMLRMNNVRIKI